MKELPSLSGETQEGDGIQTCKNILVLFQKKLNQRIIVKKVVCSNWDVALLLVLVQYAWSILRDLTTLKCE